MRTDRGMRVPGDNRPPASAWRTAALPALALLGAVLPLCFIPQIEDYLFYFRPGELLPAYGTAWVFLALLVLPVCLIAALALALLRTPAAAPPRPAYRWLVAALSGLAAGAALAALAYCLIVWLQTFGWLRGVSFRRELFWPVLILGGIAGATPPGRRRVQRLRPPAAGVAALGALCALSLPLLDWGGRGAARSAAATAGAAGTTQSRPHILLLTIDALSAEHMSLYGAARPTTPLLSAFAQGATTFEHAYADGNFTTPGVSSILTGTRPWTHRALQLPTWPDTAARTQSLPALLHRSGYRTGYVSTNAVAGAAKNGFGRYFDFASRDRVRDVNLCTDSLSAIFMYACPIADMPLFSELVNLADSLSGGRNNTHYDPRLATAPALAWLQRVDRSRPVFLWVHLFPPHSPYAAPPPWLGRFDDSRAARSIADTEPHWGFTMAELSPAQARVLADRYDESVQYVDHYAGAFLQRALELLGPDTVVVVTADHGESFRHGYGAHTGPGLFDEIIHIPLLIKLPGQTQPIRSATVVEQVDIAPTLAQLAGVASPAIWEGRSLLATWGYAAADPLPNRPVFSMNFEQNARYAKLTTGSVAVIDGTWKLIHYLGHPHYPDMPPLHDALYDLASDPGESRDVAADHPAEVASLRELIDARLVRYGSAK